MGALEEDVEQVNGRKQEKVTGETRAVMMVGGAREERRAGEAMWGPREQRTKAHVRVKRGRSHGGDLADETRGTTDRD